MPFDLNDTQGVNCGNRKDGKPRVMRKKLLGQAYKDILTTTITEDLKQELGLRDGATYADGIAMQVVKTALGVINEDKISFRAIVELRETTEGKTAEKVIAAGTSQELANLAAIMQGEPAGSDDAPEKDESYDPEVDFQNDPPEEIE
jgi:hypothetical protein